MIDSIQRKTPPTVRCAIYTRKSTEEGLEQDYNSLDAQRDAAEAYIASQKSEGWVCLNDRYAGNAAQYPQFWANGGGGGGMIELHTRVPVGGTDQSKCLVNGGLGVMGKSCAGMDGIKYFFQLHQ